MHYAQLDELYILYVLAAAEKKDPLKGRWQLLYKMKSSRASKEYKDKGDITQNEEKPYAAY